MNNVAGISILNYTITCFVEAKMAGQAIFALKWRVIKISDFRSSAATIKHIRFKVKTGFLRFIFFFSCSSSKVNESSRNNSAY